jgi:hypothetical protein
MLADHSGTTRTRTSLGRLLATLPGAALTLPVIFVALLAGEGWLYALRSFGWFSSGPMVGDSLPLLQLAGFDRQPLARVVVAWLLAGVMLGLPLARVPRRWLAMSVAPVALVLLLVASQASFALTRNLRFTDVLWTRSPGLGPWLEGLLLAAGCCVPGLILARKRDDPA